MNNEHGWPSGLALASSDNQPISINGAPPISIDGHGPCPSVHAMQVATQNSTGVSKGSFSARSDPQMRPGARDSWSGPCAFAAPARLGWPGTPHQSRLPLAARLLQRTRASQPDAMRPIAAAIFFGATWNPSDREPMVAVLVATSSHVGPGP
jgi:hypothetical protein